MKAILLICSLLLPHFSSAQTLQIDVPSGDVAALMEAMKVANTQNLPVEIIADGRFHVDQVAARSFPSITGELHISAREGRFILDGFDEPHAIPPRNPVFTNTLFDIADGGSLTLSHAEIRGFVIAGFNSGSPRVYNMFNNRGQLTLHNTLLTDNTTLVRGGIGIHPVAGTLLFATESSTTTVTASALVNNNFFFGQHALIINEGDMKLSNVLIYGQTDATDFAHANSYLENRNELILSHSTLVYPDARTFDQIYLGTAAIRTVEGSDTRLSNTIVSGSLSLCDGLVQSLGGNLVNNMSCNLTQENDLVGVDPAFRAFRYRDIQQRRYPELSLLRYSPAVDSADERSCQPTDLLSQSRNALDGNYDSRGACDRGAYERPAGRSITEGGLNGLYFDPDSDGHYLQILDFSEHLFLVWNTFDASGNQTWIYATGSLDPETHAIEAIAYINQDGILLPDGPPVGAIGSEWGAIRVELQSCNEGRFVYTADDPAFGQGEFQFQRLAYADEIGCDHRSLSLNGEDRLR